MAADKPCPQLQPSLVGSIDIDLGNDKPLERHKLLPEKYEENKIIMAFENTRHNYLATKLMDVPSKSFSEALIIGSTNPQYDKRLFIDLPV